MIIIFKKTVDTSINLTDNQSQQGEIDGLLCYFTLIVSRPETRVATLKPW